MEHVTGNLCIPHVGTTRARYLPPPADVQSSKRSDSMCRHLEALVVNGHLAADAELYLERVHADEVPGVEERLVFVRGGHEPVVRVLRGRGLRKDLHGLQVA